MKKLIIPAILGITILLGAVIATMPVERVTAVHTTLRTNIEAQDRWLSVVIPFNATAAHGTGEFMNVTNSNTDQYDDVFASVNLFAPPDAASANTGCWVLVDRDSDGIFTDEGSINNNRVHGIVIFRADTDGANSTSAGSGETWPSSVDQIMVRANATTAAASHAAGSLQGACTFVFQFEDVDV